MKTSRTSLTPCWTLLAPISTVPMLEIKDQAMTTTKRLMDVSAAAFGLIVLSPLFLLISALVKLHDGGPVFYRAKRVGKDGTLFHLLKFRSMVVNADKTGQVVTTQADSRVTPVGRVL